MLVAGIGWTVVHIVGGWFRHSWDVSWPWGRVDRFHIGCLSDQAGVVDHDRSDRRALCWSLMGTPKLTETEADRLGELVVEGCALSHYHGGGSGSGGGDRSILVRWAVRDGTKMVARACSCMRALSLLIVWSVDIA